MPDRPPDVPVDEALDRYWSAILAGGEAPPESDLDPGLAATVRRVHALDTSPAPHPAFATLLWEELMHVPVMPRVLDVLSSEKEVSPSRQRAPAGLSWWQARSSWPVAHIATALLLLVTLGIALLAVRPQPGSGPATLLPAVVALATPTPDDPGIAPLLVVPVPAGLIPETGALYWSLAYFTLPPDTPPAHLVGATWDASIGECCPGLRFAYVVDGAYTVRPDGPVQVIRAAGQETLETGQAGNEIVLGPGDALFAPSESTFTAANTGSVPVELLTAVLTARPSSTTVNPSGWVEHDLDEAFAVSLPPEAMALRLRRADLAPQSTLSPLPGSVAQVAVAASGTPVLGKQMDGGLRNIGETPVEVFVLNLERSATTDVTPEAGTPPS